jgi:large subunit ribosomal protein L25
MAEVLHVEKRTAFGKRHNRRLRQGGRLPAVLYGHGKPPESLAMSTDEFDASLRHGARIVDLDGAVTGQALLQDIQWDTFFQHVLHVDLLRVEAGDLITISVPVELRGEAPGTHEGGVVEQLVHELQIKVTPANVPERLHLNINHLELGGSLTAAHIKDVPEGATLLGDPERTIVHCIARAAEVEELELAAAEGEPEVIGQKVAEEESE